MCWLRRGFNVFYKTVIDTGDADDYNNVPNDVPQWVLFPIEQIPWFMQAISKVLSLTFVADSLRKVMVLGADIPMLTNEFTILMGLGTVMITIAVPVFKRAMIR